MKSDVCLAAAVRARAVGDWVVFLDLRADRYRALALNAMSIAGWRELGVLFDTEVDDGVDTSATGAADEATRALLQKGGLVAPRTCAPTPDRPVAKLSRPLPWAPDALAFLWACSWAGNIVAAKRLDHAVEALGAWKRGARLSLGQTDVLARYERLRLWFPRRRVCLFDALALMAFALSRGASAEWVTGVRGRPFAAHCWLETQGEVISVTEDDCASFAPIMRV